MSDKKVETKKEEKKAEKKLKEEKKEDDKNEEGEEKSEEEKMAEKIQLEMQKRSPLLQLAEFRFLLGLPDTEFSSDKKRETKEKMMVIIKEDNMGPFYEELCKQFGWMEDSELAQQMKVNNAKELKGIEDKIVDAEVNAGDTEVREFKLKRADTFARIGEKDKALKAYEETLEKTVGSGSRIDLVFSMIRLSMAHNDVPLVKKHIQQAKSFVEKGGDWERRNLLHVYEATYLLMVREFKEAAKLLLDSIATFTAYALFDYNSFVFYTCLMAIVSLDRVTLQAKVIKSPEVLAVINDIPHLKDLVFCLHKCQYRQFFQALADITPQLKTDRYIAPHIHFFIREIRIVSYAQFLESYRSVQLNSMATSFGVSVSFLDRELSRFISAGRLNCKIDKVNGIVETNRPDAKNTQYSQIIKNGDLLLNRIQKLTKLISY